MLRQPNHGAQILTGNGCTFVVTCSNLIAGFLKPRNAKYQPTSNFKAGPDYLSQTSWQPNHHLPIKATERPITFAGISVFAPTNQATGGEPQSTANTCPGDKSFTITANAAPELSGCFIGTTDPDGVFMYTVSGTTTQSKVFVTDLANDDGDVSRDALSNELWKL